MPAKYPEVDVSEVVNKALAGEPKITLVYFVEGEIGESLYNRMLKNLGVSSDEEFIETIRQHVGYLDHPGKLRIKVVRDTGSLGGVGKHFLVPEFSNYDGIGIGIDAGLHISSSLRSFIYSLPPLHPLIRWEEALPIPNGVASVTVWDCSHEVANGIFSTNNMVDIYKYPAEYGNTYFCDPPMNHGLGSIDTEADHYLKHGIDKHFSFDPPEGAKPPQETSSNVATGWWAKVKKAPYIFFGKNKTIS